MGKTFKLLKLGKLLLTMQRMKDEIWIPRAEVPLDSDYLSCTDISFFLSFR